VANDTDFEIELKGLFRAAEKSGQPYLDVKSGELHSRVGGYPGPNHRMPTCCSVMRRYMGDGDTVLNQPPSGKGANLVIRYQLPRGNQTYDSNENSEFVNHDSETVDIASFTSLSLERDLEKSLLGNLSQIEPGLSLYQKDGISGRQYDTGEVGRLDILALDGKGSLVVLELKAGRADESVCGQILRYIGWVQEYLAVDREVRGIIVANDFSDSLKYAAKAMPNVGLKKYEVRFQFTDI
jgi:RecB family endonuclease NucS